MMNDCSMPLRATHSLSYRLRFDRLHVLAAGDRNLADAEPQEHRRGAFHHWPDSALGTVHP